MKLEWDEIFVGRDSLESGERARACGLSLIESVKREDLAGMLKVLRLTAVEGGFLLIRLTTSDEAGDTALHHAVRIGRIDMAVLLLNAGLSPSIRNHRDETPLDIAETLGLKELAAKMKEKLRYQPRLAAVSF